MLISEEVEVALHSKNITYYESLGYNIPKYIDCNNGLRVKRETKLMVKIKDVPKQSNVNVLIQCDYCGEILGRKYFQYNNTKSRDIINKDCCNKCKSKKIEESNLLKYNVKNVMQIDLINEKVQKTNLEKYGVSYPLQSQDIYNKTKQSFKNNYGDLNPMQVPSIVDKYKNSMLIKYGYESALEVPEIYEKTKKSLSANGNAPSSKEQRYFGNLLDGMCNYYYKGIFLDVAFPKDMIYLEYDGSGHNLNVIFGNITQKEFDIKQIRRRYVTYVDGWKEIRVISRQDKMPKDDIIYKMIDYVKQYFNTGHSWMYFDIDNSIIKTSQFEVKYDYGKLIYASSSKFNKRYNNILDNKNNLLGESL